MILPVPYVLRNLARRRTRTFIGALGIFLTVTLLTAIQIGLDSVSTSYLDLVALQSGKADLLITAKGSEAFNAEWFDPAPVLAQLQTNSYWAGVSPRWQGFIQASARGEDRPTLLIGIDPARERKLDLSGLAPVPSLAAGTCAVSRQLAEKLALKPGTAVTLRASDYTPDLTLKVELILDRQLMFPQEVKDFVVVNEAAARSVLGEPVRVQTLAGALRQPRDFYRAGDLHGSVRRLQDAGEALAASLGTEYQVRLPKAAAITAFQNVTAPVQAVFGVFAVLALTITGLLIYSLFSVAVEERVREYAILRTLGAKGRDIFSLVLTESCVLCFLGVAPGVLTGALFARGVVFLVSLAMKANGAEVRAEISLRTLLLTLAAGVALSLGSALPPALRATRSRIVDALDPLRRGQIPARQDGEDAIQRPLILAGLALSSLSLVVFFVLPNAFLSGNPALIGAVLLCLLLSILLGLTLTAVGLLPFVEQAFLRMVQFALGPAAQLAGRNLERHRRRHRTTALLFTLSVSLVIFVASLFALFSRTALALVELRHGADLRLHSGRSESRAKSELASLPDVQAVSEVRYLNSRSEQGTAYDVLIADLVGLKQLWIVPFGVDPELPSVLYQEQLAWASAVPGALTNLAASDAAGAPIGSQAATIPPIILSLAIARFLEVDTGDVVQLTFYLGAQRQESRFRVTGIAAAMPGFDNFRGRVAAAVGAGALISRQQFDRLIAAAPPEARQSLFFIKANGGAAGQKAVAKRIREDADPRYRFGVQCTAEQQEQAKALYWATQVFFGFLLGVAVIIAVFALIASMASTVIERRWEIGVLKALGLRRRELFRMFLGEAIVVTLAAGFSGGVIGFGLAWLFMLQAAVLMETATVFTLPYFTFVATFVISITAGALAAYLPTRGLLSKTAAEILRGGG